MLLSASLAHATVLGCRISVVQARGLLRASSTKALDCAVDLGERVAQEIELEVFCENGQVDTLTGLIRRQHNRPASLLDCASPSGG